MGYLGLLSDRQLLVLWSATTCSVLGDRLYAMAVMWIAWEQFGAGAMGLVAIAESVPYVLIGAVGRGLMGRFATLSRLGAVDVARAVLVATLPLTWHGLGLPGLLASAAALGIGGALFDPNLGALIPDLVRPEQVQAMSGLMDLTGRIARVAGPGSAGILLAILPMAGLFWIDAVTFALSAIALWAFARRQQVGCAVPPLIATPVAGEVAIKVRRRTPRISRAAAVRALLQAHPDTTAMLGMHAWGIFLSAVSMALPALLASRLHAGAGTYGTVLAAVGLGSLAGNALAGNVRLPGSLPALYCSVWAATGVLLALTGLAPNVPTLLLLSAASGGLSPFLSVALATHIARFRPTVRRRLLTVDQTVVRTAGTLSMMIIPAATAAEPAIGFAMGGAAITATGTAGFVALTLRYRTVRPSTKATPPTVVPTPTQGEPLEALSPAGRG